MNKRQRKLKKFIQKKSVIILDKATLDWRPVKRRTKQYTMKHYPRINYLDVYNRHGCCIVLDIDLSVSKLLINLGYSQEGFTHAELLKNFLNSNEDIKEHFNIHEKDGEKLKRDSYWTDNRASYANLLLNNNKKTNRFDVVLLFDRDWMEHSIEEIIESVNHWNTEISEFDFEYFSISGYKSRYTKISPLQKVQNKVRYIKRNK